MKNSRQRLYVNAGAASSFGWGMLGGKTSRGMAAIFTVTASTAAAEGRVEFIDLH